MSSGLDFDVKDRIKQANEIVSYIGSELQLRRQGSNYVTHCPWHDDTRPSLQVNPAKQSWVCWPCNIRGDVFDWVMRRENVDFREAMVILAERAGIPLTQTQRKVVKGSAQDKQTLYKAMAWAEAVYHDCLLRSEDAIPAREYLRRRGISDDSIEAFQLGFAPNAWSWLVDRGRNTEFSPTILEACGLISMSQRGSWNERFKGRLLFPIRDTQQRPIAFGGRVIPGIYESGKEPPGKYVNSNETRLFSKSNNLFGLNLYARDTAARERELTIVEGYTDVIAAWQAGLRNVVAALGTAINEKHLRLIKRFADRVTLVLDGDEAGQNTANKVLDLFVAQDIDLRILTLPDGQDPFDFFQQNSAETFKRLIANAPDAMQHKIRFETSGFDLVNDTHRANQALENVLSTLARVPAKRFVESSSLALRQDQLITRLARTFQTDRDRIRQRLNELRMTFRPTSGLENDPEQQHRIDLAKCDGKEKELIQVLIHQPDLLDEAAEKVVPDDFSIGPLREIYTIMHECFLSGNDVSYKRLMVEIEDPDLKTIVDHLHDETAIKFVSTKNEMSIGLDPQKQLQSIILAFQSKIDESGKQQKISQMYQKQLDEQEELSALEELLNQTRQRQGLTPPTDG